MRNYAVLSTVLLMVLALAACAQADEPRVVSRVEATPEVLVPAYVDEGKMVILRPYEEMSDGTWRTEEHSYQYCLEITGRMRNAARDSTYRILSNRDSITFDQAWRASGLSSSTADYFAAEDAVFVGIA